MNVLGINSFFEHPAVALVADGRLLFAIEDERLTGIKHGKRYTPYRTYVPFDSMYAALRSTGLHARDLDAIAYSYDRREHLMNLGGCLTGKRISSLREELSAFLSVVNVRRTFREGHELPQKYRHLLAPADLARVRYEEWNHHRCHAASAFFCSGFEEALVIVCDGSGEAACTSVFVGKGKGLTLVHEITLPHSLGLFYSAVTRHLGFEPFADEYKVMGLAAYGSPRFGREMSEVVRIHAGGSYRVDSDRLRHLDVAVGPARLPGAAIEAAHQDIARSAQMRLEEVLEHVVTHHVRSTGLGNVCLAGGTFLNCVANGRLAAVPEVKDIFVQPAAHDAGTAIGAAALSAIRAGDSPQLRYDSMALGTSHEDENIEAMLVGAAVPHVRMADGALIDAMAERLAADQIGGLFRGRMEFGPRALGMRSILASPTSAGMRERLNVIKGREDFRPVAPLVPAEKFTEYFEGRQDRYMLFTTSVRDRARPLMPSAVHVDGTARTQVVEAAHDAFLHALLQAFGRRSGVPVLINTSFNAVGKPIVESPRDALAILWTTRLDFVVLGSYLVERRTNCEPSQYAAGQP